MKTQIDNYIENIKKDYVGWSNPKTENERTVRDNMVKESRENIPVKPRQEIHQSNDKVRY